jgi:cytochrome P450
MGRGVQRSGADPGRGLRGVAVRNRASARVAAENIEVDGTRIEAASLVALSTLSAMPDEAVYPRPDAFDIRRTDQPRVRPIFGAGVHRCLGEARVDLEEALAALTARIPRLRLDQVPVIQRATRLFVASIRCGFRGRREDVGREARLIQSNRMASASGTFRSARASP